MKSLTIIQPWASLIAYSLKEYETRSWSTKYRGEIAIHAGKKWGTSEQLMWGRIKQKHTGTFPWNRPELGAIIAICKLEDVIPTEKLYQKISIEERMLGDYSKNRYGWKLTVLELLEKPILCSGKQGLWEWNRD